jgi:hypothetical protein
MEAGGIGLAVLLPADGILAVRSSPDDPSARTIADSLLPCYACDMHAQ